MFLKRRKEIVHLAERGGTCYISAMVLGLNDALVELSGALAGFTMALQNNRLIILAGLTTGIAATLSMAASEFLSQEADDRQSHPFKAAIYTGFTYFITVVCLLLPFFIFDKPMTSLCFCMLNAALVIMIFTFIVSKIRKTNFFHDFLQMISISFSVAAISFGLSWLARMWWGIDL